MGRGGKVSGKRSFKKRARPEEGSSDDSDDDYVVSDEDRSLSDCVDDSCSLDQYASEESFDDSVEEEEEIQRAGKFNRSKVKHGVCEQQNNESKTTRKRGRIIYAEQQELEQDEDEGEDKDKDEDFHYDEGDEEFTPEEEDYSDEEEETVGGKKKNNAMKTGKKVSQRRVSKASTGPRKRRTTRASKRPLRKKRRKVGGLRRKVRCGDADDFIDDGSAIRTRSRKRPGRKRRRLDPESSCSDSDCVSFGSSDYGLSISEEEREQMREAKELCGRLRRNLKRSSLLLKNNEVGVHDDDLQQQRKPPGQKGKEKIQEPQGRKGKEKEVRKPVCGICLSEEDKRRVRGVLDCCTHYFCYACIMEWAKVESRCPLCKQRFKTVIKPARTLRGLDVREVVVQVPERDQVYQPSEEELMSYMDPYEYVICLECYQGGDDGLMLLCDMCDSPAHTYCVGLGREVPEGNWYCNGCRPVALASSTSSQVQDQVAGRRVTTTQSLPVRLSPILHGQESIDLNLMSSPRTSSSQGFGLIPSLRFSGRSVEGSSLVSGGGTPTVSERWLRIHRQIHQLLSVDRLTSPGIANGISTTRSTNNLHPSQIDQSMETATQQQHTRTQDDVGTSFQTFFEESLWDNTTSPLMQNGGDPFSVRISSNIRSPIMVPNSIIFANRSMNGGVLWPSLVEVPSSISNYELGHQFSSRSNIVPDGSLSPAIKEESSNFHIVKEQLQTMVKNHLKGLCRDIDLGTSTFKDIAESSTHTILAACGLEHNKSEVCCSVPPPSVCPHIELMAGGPTSLIKGCCSSCFESFVGEVVKVILDTRMSPQWLQLGL